MEALIALTPIHQWKLEWPAMLGIVQVLVAFQDFLSLKGNHDNMQAIILK